jgi:hypothetical protein
VGHSATWVHSRSDHLTGAVLPHTQAVTSLANSVGMGCENAAISSLSFALGRMGKALVAFSSIARTLTVCVLGTGGATSKTMGMVPGPDDPDSCYAPGGAQGSLM